MITFEEIKKANESIKTTDIKGKEYAEVNQRIKAFRMVYPQGAISTEIVSLENGVVTMRAIVTNGEGGILATGTAQEKESSSYINKTSFIENCETSVVGRALGFCGFGIDTSVASYEEVANAIENQKPKKPQLSPELLKQADQLAIDIDKVAVYLKKKVSELTDEDLQKCIEQKRKAREEASK